MLIGIFLLTEVVFRQELFVTLVALPLTFGFPQRLNPPWSGDSPLTPSPEGAEKGGVDHCLIINDWKPDGAMRPAVTLSDPASGRLEILTDQPGIQVYKAIILTHHSQERWTPIDNMQRSA